MRTLLSDNLPIEAHLRINSQLGSIHRNSRHMLSWFLCYFSPLTNSTSLARLFGVTISRTSCPFSTRPSTVVSIGA
jgi:hypothetical protein